jgi:hypothetical protein
MISEMQASDPIEKGILKRERDNSYERRILAIRTSERLRLKEGKTSYK